MNILVVDDSKTILAMISFILSDKGHQITCLSSAEAALEFLSTNKPELLITDINMPGIGGKNFIKKLRSDEAFKKLPIMVNSTKPDTNDLDELINCWISKPLNANKLLQAIEQFV